MQSDVTAWLTSIGCGAHAAAFEENAISLDLLVELTEADLRELDLNMGERKRVLRAIAALRAEAGQGGAAPARGAQAAQAAERRRLTVMFVDLVGSTDIASRLDPEACSDVIRRYQDVVAGMASRFGGHVAQYLGDGVLCYFGWPRAFEDAAVRAVEAGLRIAEAVSAVRALEQPLRCRIGIATGLVVVGELLVRGDVHDETAIGETPNLAARLQALAQPGQVVVSEQTRRLVGGHFALRPLGAHRLKGLPGKHQVFAALGEKAVHDRFLARAGPLAGELVGRASELAALLERWRASCAGDGQVVVLVGEAGIGKSHLGRALTRAMGKAERQIAQHCSPYHRDTALWPVASQLRAAAGLRETDDDARALQKLARLLQRVPGTGDKAVGLVAELLNLSPEGAYDVGELAPSARRGEVLEALAAQVLGLARQAPLMILLEDVHWCDPTTLELTTRLARQCAGERLMLLLTSRPEGCPPLPELPNVTRIDLDRLGRDEAEAIVARVGGGTLPPATVSAIIARADGVPLFVEELTKALVESGESGVPASLHDTLMARLDRVADVKEIAQIASVIGRDFETDPLAQVAALSQRKVRGALEKLGSVELVFPHPGVQGRYSFKHALVRDAAYESLLKRRRQQIHDRIFDVLRDSERTAPAVLAHHAAEAGRTADAVTYGRMAAEEALRRPAYAEALTHIEGALGILAADPHAPAAQQQRKHLLRLAGEARIAHSGYAAEATVATFAEIERIGRETGDAELLLSGLYGRWAASYVPGRNPVALEVADTVCQVAAGTDDGLARSLGHRLRGTVLTMMGRVGEATAALAEAARHYDPAVHPRQAGRFGQDVGVARKCYMTGIHVLRAELDAAERMAREIQQDIGRLDHVHTSGYALGHLSVFLCAAGLQPAGVAVAERCIALSQRNRMPLWEALGCASLAMAGVLDGRAAAVADDFARAMEMLQRVQFGVFDTILLPPFALALAAAGDPAAGAGRLRAARRLMAANEARFPEAEVARTEARLAVMAGDGAAARGLLAGALEQAGRAGHRLWQRRAAGDLAALLVEDGEHAAARDLLDSVGG